MPVARSDSRKDADADIEADTHTHTHNKNGNSTTHRTCNTLQHNAPHHTTLKYSASHCDALQNNATPKPPARLQAEHPQPFPHIPNPHPALPITVIKAIYMRGHSKDTQWLCMHTNTWTPSLPTEASLHHEED